GIARPLQRTRRDLVTAAANQVTQRVAAERITREQNHVRRQDETSDADAKLPAAGSVGESEPVDCVDEQNDEEQQREIEEVAVHVLQDERKRSLAEIGFSRFSDRTPGRVSPERLVVRAAVVIAG